MPGCRTRLGIKMQEFVKDTGGIHGGGTGARRGHFSKVFRMMAWELAEAQALDKKEFFEATEFYARVRKRLRRPGIGTGSFFQMSGTVRAMGPCIATATLQCITLQHTATHCNTLQQTATHCNTRKHTATHYNTLQHSATHCNTLQHTARGPLASYPA